jgi:hypothetical protein
MCDRAEVAFEPDSEKPGAIDLRDEPGVGVREKAPKKARPPL